MHVCRKVKVHRNIYNEEEYIYKKKKDKVDLIWAVQILFFEITLSKRPFKAS
jgi:hypothetical protein